MSRVESWASTSLIRAMANEPSISCCVSLSDPQQAEHEGQHEAAECHGQCTSPLLGSARSPGAVSPVCVVSDSAPPSVFRPKAGFAPGTSVRVFTENSGTMSQFTTSPKGSLMRTPSM